MCIDSIGSFSSSYYDEYFEGDVTANEIQNNCERASSEINDSAEVCAFLIAEKSAKIFHAMMLVIKAAPVKADPKPAPKLPPPIAPLPADWVKDKLDKGKK
jgi:hypothetical protein